MHWYKRNIGDYHTKAGRLSALEHGVYTLLLDACYDRERFPTLDEAIDWCWLRTDDEIEACKFVLDKFFSVNDEGFYVQSRVEEEIEAYKISGLVNQLVALSREARKKKNDGFAKACDSLKEKIKHAPLSKTHAAWTQRIEKLINEHEAPPNQEPRTNNQQLTTNNQELITKEIRTPASGDTSPNGDPNSEKPEKPNLTKSELKKLHPEIPGNLIDEWYLVRKDKRLKTLTKTSWAHILKEIKKSNLTNEKAIETCVVRGWGGFEASWLARASPQAQQAQQGMHNFDNVDYSMGVKPDGGF